jgi:acylphosphatase
MNERFEATVSGRVQLVMYRDFVARGARALKLTGEVKNLEGGTVRVIAEGPRDALEKLLARMRRGSLLSRVDEIGLSWLPARGGYTSFTISYE